MMVFSASENLTQVTVRLDPRDKIIACLEGVIKDLDWINRRAWDGNRRESENAQGAYDAHCAAAQAHGSLFSILAILKEEQ